MAKLRLVGFFAVVAVAVVAGARMPQQNGSAPPRVTQDDYDRWTTELSNWGRWGKDDEMGALNLITPEKRKQAVALAREAFPVSLASDADTMKAVDNPQPYEHTMLGIGSDKIAVEAHGITHTHLDSLAHVNANGVFYNGYKPDPEAVKQGHSRNSILNFKNGIVTRGILIDIPRLKGVPYLEPGTPIYVEDLEAWEKRAGVKVSAGDAVFVRAGVWARRRDMGPWLRGRYKEGRQAGLDPSVIPWLKKRDVALLGADHPAYVWPSHMRGTVHDFALLYLGVPLLDNCDLEALSAAAAARKRWEFMFTAAPLPIRGGTGSPVNPIALF